jgi:integrase
MSSDFRQEPDVGGGASRKRKSDPSAPKRQKSDPSKRSSRDDALSPEDWDTFIRAARSPEERLRCRLAGIWGLRADEVGHTVLEWLSAAAGTLTVPRRCRCQYCRASGQEWTPKTPSGNRTLPVTKDPATWIAAKDYFARGPRGPVSSRTVHRTVVRVADRAGLFRPVYPHSLRATAATRFAAKGLNEHALARVMGWADGRPAREYVQASGIDAARALEDVDLGF